MLFLVVVIVCSFLGLIVIGDLLHAGVDLDTVKNVSRGIGMFFAGLSVAYIILTFAPCGL